MRRKNDMCCDNGGREWYIHDKKCPMYQEQPKESVEKYRKFMVNFSAEMTILGIKLPQELSETDKIGEAVKEWKDQAVEAEKKRIEKEVKKKKADCYDLDIGWTVLKGDEKAVWNDAINECLSIINQ